MSWNDRDYLALDHRHATEGLRALVTDALSKGKNDSTFRQWTHVPGALAAKAKQIRSKFDSYRKLANNE